MTIHGHGHRFVRGRGVLGATVAALLFGCGEDVALRVDVVGFPASSLFGLSGPAVEELSLLTAVGIAVSRGEVERLGEREVRRAVEDRILRRLDEEDALRMAGIDEAALEQWYADHPEPELVVRHLVVLSDRWDSEEERARAVQEVEAALDRIKGGEPFPDVAGEVSEEPGAEERGGLLAPGRKGSWVEEFWRAAEALKEGGVSGVVETQYGFHILRLDDRRAVPFEEARWRAISRLVAERGLLPPEGRSPVPDSSDPTDREARLAEAGGRGIDLSQEEGAEILARWVARVERWGEVLGFERGTSADLLAEQALSALGLRGQEAAIVRREILDNSDTILATYPIERPLP